MKNNLDALKILLHSYCDELPTKDIVIAMKPTIQEAMDAIMKLTKEHMKSLSKDDLRMFRFSLLCFLLMDETDKL